jgi:hypothetical protein
MERLLEEIVEKLRKAHGDTLVSVVLYGSGAVPSGRDARSDYNVLCILKKVTSAELRAAEPVFRWWREMQNPSPLLMSVEEVRTSTDAFPIEFHDIRENHLILWGEDLVSTLSPAPAFYRAHVEHELRAKLLRLRQKAGGMLSDPELLLRLMTDSVSTFCVLFRHALWLNGDAPKFSKREVIDAAAVRFGIDTGPFDTLLDLREGRRKAKSVTGVEELFERYLAGISSVISAVDACKN